MLQIRSPLQAQIVQWLVAPGDTVPVLEAKKMDHEVRVGADGRVVELLFAVGGMGFEHELLLISDRLTHIPRGL